MTLALLQELLMTLRANDADDYRAWLALGIEQLGKDVAGEVESDWMVPLLLEAAIPLRIANTSFVAGSTSAGDEHSGQPKSLKKDFGN